MAQTIAIVVFDFVFFCQDRSFIDFSGAPKSDINNKKIFIVYNNFIAMNSSLNNSLKAIVTTALSLVPNLGILSKFINLFWPSTGDVWSQVKNQVQNLIQKDILDEFITQTEAQLNTIKEIFINYFEEKYQSQKSAQIENLLTQIDLVQNYISADQARRKFYLPLIVQTAVLHFFLLNERLKNGTALFGVPEADPVWKKDFINAYNIYYPIIKNAFIDWKKWYGSQISFDTHIPVSPHFRGFSIDHGKITKTITNQKTGQTVVFAQVEDLEQYDPTDYIGKSSSLVYQRMVNEAVNQMINYLMPFYQTARLVPQNNEQYILPDQVRTFQLGPYCAFLKSNSSQPCPNNVTDCTVNTASTIDINVDNIIEGIGFTDEDGSQPFFGNVGKNQTFNIQILLDETAQEGKRIYCNGLTFRVYNYIFTSVTTHYANDPKKEHENEYGNGAGWDYHYNFDMISKSYGYALNGGYFGSGTSNGYTSVNYAKLVFSFRSDCATDKVEIKKE